MKNFFSTRVRRLFLFMRELNLLEEEDEEKKIASLNPLVCNYKFTVVQYISSSSIESKYDSPTDSLIIIHQALVSVFTL
jgi:hypothetical protein